MSTPDEPDDSRLRSILALVLVAVVIATLAVVRHERTSAEPAATPSSPAPSSPATPSASRPAASPSPTRDDDPATPQETLPAPRPLQRTTERGGDRCVRLGGGPVTLAATTFNIHSGLANGRLHLDGLAAAIDSWDSDLVLLQEVSRNRGRVRRADEPTTFGVSLDMSVAYGVNMHPPDGGEFGVLTLSRYPIVSSTNTLLPTAPGAQQRGLLRTVVDVEGTHVAVYNTHLQDGYFSLRLRQMRAISAVLAREELPMILGGDLNTVPGSPVITMTRPLLSDSFGQVGAGEGATIPATRPRIRIDYLLHSAPLVALRSQVMPLTVSDHRAVRTSFELPADGERVCVPVLPSRGSHR